MNRLHELEANVRSWPCTRPSAPSCLASHETAEDLAKRSASEVLVGFHAFCVSDRVSAEE
jgi:hypothetical protein